MVAEPWGVYPPEINAGRMETGVGAPTWLTAALQWEAYALYTEEMAAALALQTAELTGNWLGGSPVQYAAGAAAYAAWLAEMQAMATTNAATSWAVLQSYSTAMATHVPLAVVIANRIAARVADIAGALGAPNTEMVRLELEYAAYWAHNASVMTGYDVAGNTATMFKPVPPPPPLVVGDGFVSGSGTANAAAQQAMDNAGQTGQSAAGQASQMMQSATSGMMPANMAGPGYGDTAMWANQLGGAGGGDLGAFGSGGGGSGGDLSAGGGGGIEVPGLMPAQMPFAQVAPVNGSSGVMPLSSFGGVSNTPTAARPAMPMMPPPSAAGAGKRREAATIAPSAPITAAFPEFPITAGITSPENVSEEISEENAETVQRPL